MALIIEAARRILTIVFGGAASTTGVLSAVTDTGTSQTITVGFKGPAFPSRITATAGGTSGDIKAITVSVTGTAPGGAVITETLPAFTVDTPGTVTGSYVFETVTSVTIPAHDDTGATTAIGFGEKLGIGLRLARNTVKGAYLAETVEGTAPTVVVDATNLEGNTADLNSALNSTQVKLEVIPTSN